VPFPGQHPGTSPGAPVTAVDPVTGGWVHLHALFREKAPPVVTVDCPHCGWPLQQARGVTFCPHGDYRRNG
jgi:hypothetical protein